MSGKEYLFESLGQIADRYVLEADEKLGLSKSKNHRGGRKLWRTVLIAAVIASLMGVTAYAAVFYGMKERTAPIGEAEIAVTTKDQETGAIRDELQTVPVVVGSPNGVTGSPEYQAAQEWFAFTNAYEAQKEAEAGDAYSWEDYELSFAGTEREKAIAEIYFAYDRTMLDKLLEIAEKYDLRLLTEEKGLIWSEEDLCGLTGLRPFITRDGNDFGYAYCFEDGSFQVEGTLELNGQEVVYEATRTMAGCLYPYTYYLAEDTEYEEWEYRTAGGQTVDIAVTSTPEPDGETHYSMTVFFDRNGAFVEITGDVSAADGETVAYRALAEALADSFDLDALTAAGGVDAAAWDAWTQKPRPEQDQIPLTRFCPNGEEGSPEYLAMVEWSRFLDAHEAAAGDPELSFAKNETERAIAEIYDASDRTALDKLLEIADKYQLRLYTGSTTVHTEEALCALAGIEPYRKDSQNWVLNDHWYAWCLEDGGFRAFGPGFRLDGQEGFCYVSRFREGGLIHFDWYRPAEGSCEEWTYTTADGQRVDILVWEGEAWDYDFYIFYNRNGNHVILKGSFGDGSQSGIYDPRAIAESLAEMFDLEALTA